ncbi:hypothetical protein J3E68DRAFT_405732 [Trichoderma sp. SZMC 28012]
MNFWEEEVTEVRRPKRFKRGHTACRRCRSKKTKCDNRRPSCGVCVENHVQCVYGELDGQQILQEPTLTDVMNRIDHVAQLLELSQRPAYAGSTDSNCKSLHSSSPSLDTAQKITFPGSSNLGRPAHAVKATGISFEATTKWPIIHNIISQGIISPRLPSSPSTTNNSPHSQRDEPPAGFRTGNAEWPADEITTPLSPTDKAHIQNLCQRYLTVAHVKNPIFDVSRFNLQVKAIIDGGFDWGEDSCVVMLACALANTVKQVGESFEYSNPSPGSYNQIFYESSGLNCIPGDAFYLAAKKRLGLLDVTLTSVQCFFLAGLYEVCRLRPTNAWVHYSQACSRLQFILSHRNVRDDSLDTEFHVLERLYFSCCRTERDLREELDLPPAGITSLHFPREFPSLPSWTSFHGSVNENSSNTNSNWQILPSSVIQQQEEHSWYYYLACIALRKKADSINDLLYEPGEHVWLANVEHVMAQAILQEHELDQWRTILPKTLEFDADDGAPEDLAFILECRQLQWRQISYRPLLYYALHKPDTDPYFDRVLPLAQKCLQYCALTIKRLTRPHYYEATWFSYRAISTATLLILAAQLRGPPLYVHNWQALVSLSLRVLAARTARAAYIDQARPVLETLLKHVTKDHE